MGTFRYPQCDVHRFRKRIYRSHGHSNCVHRLLFLPNNKRTLGKGTAPGSYPLLSTTALHDKRRATQTKIIVNIIASILHQWGQFPRRRAVATFQGNILESSDVQLGHWKQVFLLGNPPPPRHSPRSPPGTHHKKFTASTATVH